MNYSHIRTDLSISAPSQNLSAGANDGYSSLQVQFTSAVSETVVVGIGGTYGLNNIKTATWPSGYENFAKDCSTFDLITGYVVTDKTLLFGKLSHFMANGYAPSAPTSTFSGTGTGYGLGARQLLTPKIFAQAEYVHTIMNDLVIGTTVEGGSTNVLSIGVGYQF